MAYQPGSGQPAARGAGWLPRMAWAIADLLFPARCVGCGALGAWLCGRCLSGVDVIRPPVCPGCGRPLAVEAPAETPVDLCRQCRSAPFQLDGLRAYGLHTGVLREAIHQLKYEGLAGLAPVLGQAMSRAWPDLAPGCDLTVLVPVPLHAARQRERGYNQAALLARELARGLGRPLADGCLFRTRHTRPQVGLSGPDRHANVADAFCCEQGEPGALAGQRVLLVDDVCTTGATLEAAAAALRRAGAQSVWAYTLARAG